MDRQRLSSSHGVKSKIPQAPWVLHFDGASRKPAGHGGLGVVLRNGKGQVVEEEKRFLGAGVSSGMAKYKALVAGLKKAQGLQVKHLLAKGNSRILINQVVGRWTARDALLRDHLKKVWAIAKDFDSLFMEFIPKEHNLHADRIANAAIDKELQIQEVVSDYFDRSGPAWQFQASPQTSTEQPPPANNNNNSPPAAQALTPFSNPKSPPVSPPRQSRHEHTGYPRLPLKSSLRDNTSNKNTIAISHPRTPALTSASELTGTTNKPSNATKADKFWADRLSISDEASSTSSTSSTGSDVDERTSFFRSPRFKPSSRPAGESNGTVVAGSRRGPCEQDDDNDDDDEDDVCEELVADHLQQQQQDWNKKAAAGSRDRSGAAVENNHVAEDPPTVIQLSEADCERLVETVIERLKKTASHAGQPS